MTRHVLIIGHNLTALVTAYRLLHRGFHISIADTSQKLPLSGNSITTQASGIVSESQISSTDQNHSVPLILHGFYRATWVLLQELSIVWPISQTQSVDLKFGTGGDQTIALPKPSQLSWAHPLARLTFFKALPWTDRWNIINFIEKEWEENRLRQPNSDTDSAESFLIATKQSDHSRSHFWNPLSRFFLQCDLPEASLAAFHEVLSRYWFKQASNATNFLTPGQYLNTLKAELLKRLLDKGVKVYHPNATLLLHTKAERIQSVQLGNDQITAQAYVSTLGPHNLVSLLPERELARNAYFSDLAHIQEHYGLAIQFTLHDIHFPPRIILHAGLFDWITNQTNSDSHKKETVITCMTLRNTIIQEHSEDSLISQAWACIQNIFNLRPTQTQQSSDIHILRRVGPYFPSYRGIRGHRPLPTTPIANLFLACPWTANNLPPSLETEITSANACASALAETFHANLN